MGLLLLVGLLAVRWFHPGYLIKTEDVALPFTPARWWQYAHAWNNLIDLGIQFWENFAGLVFLSVPAALQGLGLSMAVTQRIEYVLWFTLPGLSMYFLMIQIAPGPSARATRLVASVFYMCNLYLEPIWQGLNIANLSAYAALPVLLGLVIIGMARPKQWWTIPVIGLVSLTASGAGTNPPLLVVALLPIPLYVVCRILYQRQWRQPKALLELLQYFGKVLVVVLAINSFWWLPQLASFQEQGPIATMDRATAIDISRSWVRGVSAATSPLNTLRLQGHWVWFEGRGDEPYTPYAQFFKSNPWLVLISFLIPAWVWGALLAVVRPVELFFAGLALVGVWLSLGVHPPFGLFYDWMIQHVPFFWIIRSPWYKFSLLTCLGYAVLLGGVANQLYHSAARRLDRQRWRQPRMVLAAVRWPISILLFSLVYAFPVSWGQMYPTSRERKYLAPSHIQLPAYLHEAAGWVNAQPWIRRLMVFPKQRVFATTWGFTDYMPPLTYFTLKPLVFNYGQSGWTATETSQVLSAIQRAVRQGITPDLQHLLALFNIDAVELSHDVVTAQQVDPGDYPAKLVAKFSEQPGITPVYTAGPLTFYRVGASLPHLYAVRHVTVVEGDPAALPTLANARFLDPPALLLSPQQDPATLRTLWAQGMIRRLVCFNAAFHQLAQRIPALQQALQHDRSALPPIELLYTSGHMETVLGVTPRDLAMTRVEGVSEPESFGGHAWQWLLTNNKPNLIIMNRASKWRYGNLRFVAYGHGRPRSLYTYLNGVLISQDAMAEGAQMEIRIPRVRFQPGQNAVAFYSPEAHDARGDRIVNFALREFELGAPVIAQSVELPTTGRYRIRWYLEGSPDEPVTNRLMDSLQLGGRRIALRRQRWAGRPFFVSDPVMFESGTYRMECAPSIQTPLALHLSLEQAGAAAPAETLTESTLTFRSPTLYDVASHTTGLQLLVFAEGFHPAWRFVRKGMPPQRPLPVNGCVNGYLLTAAEPFTGRLEFIPQRQFLIGSAVTLLTIAGCLGGLGRMAILRRHRRAPQ